MTKRLQYREIGQFDEDGIREIHKNRYKSREGTIRRGTIPDYFYIDRARRLYCHEGVDRIILLSRKLYEKDLEKLADEIIEKCYHEWKRFPNDFLIRGDEYTFTGEVDIIERKKEGKVVEIIQIDLISSFYAVAEYYLSDINKNPQNLPKNLVRILAGIYPREWKEKLPEGTPHYNPADVLQIIVSITGDEAMKTYFNFFREFFTKKSSDIEEMLAELETLLKTPTRIHAGLSDLHMVLRIIHKSLSLESISETLELRSEIDVYFERIPNPDRFTDMLFRKKLELFSLLQKFQEANDLQDKLYYLEESRKKIRESEIVVKKNFVEPFKKFYLDILEKWIDITIEEGGYLLGRPFIEAELQTKRAIRKEDLEIWLNVRNSGIGAAEKVKAVLQNSHEYEIIGQDCQEIGILQRNKDVDVEFRINPLGEGSITLAFSIFYEDNDRIDMEDTLIFVEQEGFSQIENPYYFTRPAKDDMFFGREDLFQWIERNMKGSDVYQNVLIIGERRIGKTSFLKELQERFDPSHHCIFIDLELFPSLNDVDFLYEICNELHYKVSNNSPPPDLMEFAKKSYMAFGNYVRILLSDMSEIERIVLIFDEFDKIESMIKDGLFNARFLLYLRAFLQINARVNAIIGGNFDSSRLDSPEWLEFFTIFNPKIVGVLDEDAATALVIGPVKDVLKYDYYAIKKILDFSGRNPFYIQLLCHTLVNYINEEKKQGFVEAEDVNAVVLSEAREKADSVLRLTWGELDPVEKSVLCTLSRLKAQHGRSIELGEIGEYLRQNNIRIKRWNLFKLLDSLKEKHFITKSGDSPSFYDFNILLLGEWVAEHGRLVGE
jgi:hypothetical protein